MSAQKLEELRDKIQEETNPLIKLYRSVAYELVTGDTPTACVAQDEAADTNSDDDKAEK